MMTNWSRSTMLALGTASAVVIGTMVVVYLYKKWKGNSGAMDFVEVGKLEKIIIYPVKSLGGIEVSSGTCEKLGLKVDDFRDRSWLVIRENGHFITQRQEPMMALIQPSLHPGELWLDAPDMDTLKVVSKDEVTAGDKVLKCDVWGYDISAVDCGEEAAKWLQMFLKKPGIRLVQHCPTLKPRETIQKGSIIEYDPKDYPIIFSDQTSYMLVNRASVDELNRRIEKEEEQVTYRHFRPNFVVTGNVAFQEDEWKYIQIGDDATFVQCKPCTRCTLTTINPATGKKSDENEPLNTLRKFRLTKNEKLKPVYGQSPMFGISLGLEVEGNLEIGDPVLAVLGPSTV